MIETDIAILLTKFSFFFGLTGQSSALIMMLPKIIPIILVLIFRHKGLPRTIWITIIWSPHNWGQLRAVKRQVSEGASADSWLRAITPRLSTENLRVEG